MAYNKTASTDTHKGERPGCQPQPDATAFLDHKDCTLNTERKPQIVIAKPFIVLTEKTQRLIDACVQRARARAYRARDGWGIYSAIEDDRNPWSICACAVTDPADRTVVWCARPPCRARTFTRMMVILACVSADVFRCVENPHPVDSTSAKSKLDLRALHQEHARVIRSKGTIWDRLGEIDDLDAGDEEAAQ